MNETEIQHPITLTLNTCKSFCTLILNTPVIQVSEIQTMCQSLLPHLEKATLEMYKLLAGIEYTNELIASLQTELKHLKDLA
jgi:hypothetical protein